MSRFDADPDDAAFRAETGRARPAKASGPAGFLALVLALVAGFILFLIVSGTVWAFVQSSSRSGGQARSLFSGGKRNPVPDDVIASDPAGTTAVFSDIGMLRAATADKKPVTVVISPFLPYRSSDIPFSEELVQKTRTIRAFILDWFHSRTIKEIGKLGEAGVKAALLEGINRTLVLGKIDAIYFSEYMVIE